MLWQYIKMIRFHIVAGGLLAFVLGALLAFANGGSFDLLRIALFYTIVFLGDLSTHFSNDYFDVEQDRLIGKKRFFSGNKILVNNPRLQPFAKTLSVALLFTSVLLAALAVTFQMAPVDLLLITLGANFLGWFYSAPPLRLVSRGLGEVAIVLAVGFAIPAAGYLAVMGHFDGWFAFFVLPFVLYGFMLALSLEAPDVEGDRLGNKKTFGVKNGVDAVFGLVFAVALAAMVMFLVCAWQFSVRPVSFWAIVAFSTLPLAAGLLGFLCVHQGKKSQTFSAVNIFSLFAFNMLMVAYLFIVVSSFS
jgi:1,4-dihydroxy-2-naphthoate octaprenyltransferase